MARRDLPPRPGFRFPGPVPEEALRFLRSKRLRPSFSHLDVSSLEHAYAFTVAKSTGFDILGDVKRVLDEHLDGGGTLRTFSKELTPILEEKGWWGAGEVTDPRTGERVTAQLGSPRRLKTIFRSNMRSARAAGQWERIQRTKRSHPYLLYSLGPSREHREEHVRWAGTLLPADDPWWADHFPPNGWGCNCRVRQVSRAEYERLRGRDGIRAERPRRDPVSWTNPRTGQAVEVDRGLDPSWASNPGLDREWILAEHAIGKLEALPEGLGREAVRQFVESPLLERHLSGKRSGDPPKGDLPVGWLDPESREALGVQARVARMTSGTAKKEAGDHAYIRPGDWPRLLPVLFHDADLVVPHPPPDGIDGLMDLDFVRQSEDGRIWRLSVRAHDDRRARLTTLHRIQPRHARSTARRGKPLRDRRGWGRQ